MSNAAPTSHSHSQALAARIPEPLDRAAAGIGVAGILSVLFHFGTTGDYNFVTMTGASLVVFPLLGLVAVVGALRARRSLVIAAGAGYAVAALVQLIQFGHATNWLSGSGSTYAALLSLAIGLLVVGLAPRDV